METAIGSKILEHLLISVIPLLAGIVLGGGLGVAGAFLVRLIFSALPWLHKLAILLPWRTLLVSLVLLTWSPFLVMRFGLGMITGAITVFLVISLVALVSTMALLIEHWYPSPLAVRFLSATRLLATTSGAIAVGVGFVSSSGLGSLMMRWIELLDYKLVWQGLLALAVLALVPDLLVGVAQLVVVSFMAGGKEKIERPVNQVLSAQP